MCSLASGILWLSALRRTRKRLPIQGDALSRFSDVLRSGSGVMSHAEASLADSGVKVQGVCRALYTTRRVNSALANRCTHAQR